MSSLMSVRVHGRDVRERRFVACMFGGTRYTITSEELTTGRSPRSITSDRKGLLAKSATSRR